MKVRKFQSDLPAEIFSNVQHKSVDRNQKKNPKLPDTARMHPVKPRIPVSYHLHRSVTSSGRSRKHTWKRWRSYAGWMLHQRRRRGRR